MGKAERLGSALNPWEVTPMSRDFTVERVASVEIVLGQRDDGCIVAGIRAELMGTEPTMEGYFASTDNWDEVTALMADFHNAWKGWGGLVDQCVADLAHTQMRLSV